MLLRLCYNLLMRFLAFLLLLYLSKNKKSRKALILPAFQLCIWHPLRESNSQLTLRRGLLLRSKKVLTAVKICGFGNGEGSYSGAKRFSQPSKSVVLVTARGSYSGAKRFSQPSKSVILETARGSYSHLTYQIAEATNCKRIKPHIILNDERLLFFGTPCGNRTHN